MAATVEIDEANGALKSSGTANVDNASKLEDTGANFTADGVDIGDQVFNSTGTVYAFVTALDSATVLSLSSDAFPAGTESYEIHGELTHNISDTDMSTEDSPTTDPVANPVTPGNNTMHKYQQIHVTAMGGSSLIDNLQVWRTGALGGTATHKTNARTTSYAQKPYVAPSTTATAQADQTMPSADPAAANLGIAGSLTGSIATSDAESRSDMLVHQIQTNGGDTAGSTSTMNYQYDETA